MAADEHGGSAPPAPSEAARPDAMAARPVAPAQVVVVDRRSDFKAPDTGLLVLTAREYLARPELVKARGARVINLSRSYVYLGVGYYCSLLAEARGHRVIPAVETALELSQRSLYRHALPELTEDLRKRVRRMANPPETSFSLRIFFGQTDDRRFAQFARRIFDQWRVPLLKATIRWKDDWTVHAVEPLGVDELWPEETDRFAAALDAYTRASWRVPKAKASARRSLAILHDPKDPTAPSDARALQRFVRAGDALGIDVELIEKKDFLRLAEYDALFIRETTAIDHHTYRFARKAEQEGMPVIDDPTSILKCTNKVYLTELLRAHRLPAPRTVIVDKSRVAGLEREIPFPIVLKIPDGSSSRGVFRVSNRDELEATCETLFEESDLLLAQEFMFTAFDWRVGVLNRRPLYACQYAMAKKHWKILKHASGGGIQEGDVRTLLVEETPAEVVRLAVEAAGTIGDGLYGVDIKQTDKGLFVIEVNDNPSIDAGIEDQRLKEELYRLVMREFLRRMDARAGT